MRKYEFLNPWIVNVRDLGGYRCDDGRHVKEGLLIRGISTVDFSKEDCQQFLSMNIGHILDLRANGEILRSPNKPLPIPYSHCSAMNLDGREIDFSPESIAYMHDKLDHLGNPMDYLYIHFPYQNPALALAFELLENREVPLYFHCAAGKDRTGLLAALILLALGVSLEDARSDFLYSNEERKKCYPLYVQMHPERFKSEEDRVRFNHAFYVHGEMFDRTFAYLLEKYGDFETYFKEELGFDRKRLSKLRDYYCQ